MGVDCVNKQRDWFRLKVRYEREAAIDLLALE
jgi:hypothetical protein